MPSAVKQQVIRVLLVLVICLGVIVSASHAQITPPITLTWHNSEQYALPEQIRYLWLRVANTSDSAISASITLTAPDGFTLLDDKLTRIIDLDPHQTVDIGWSVRVPAFIGIYEFAASVNQTSATTATVASATIATMEQFVLPVRTPSLGYYVQGEFIFIEGLGDSLVLDMMTLGQQGQPLVGDWNGDGYSDVGIYAEGVFLLKTITDTTEQEYEFTITDVDAGYPVVGDWNGDGRDGVGVLHNGIFYLRNDLSTGTPDLVIASGSTTPNVVPLAGDWNGDDVDTIGLYQAGYFRLRTQNFSNRNTIHFPFGLTDDTLPIIADWNGDKRDTVGVFVGNYLSLRDSLTPGIADATIELSREYRLRTPLVGYWRGADVGWR